MALNLKESCTNLILRWTQTPADLVNRVFQSNNMSAGNWLSKASLLNIRKSLCKSSSFVLLKFFTYFKASGWQQSLGDSKDRDVRKLKGLSFEAVSSENIILLLKYWQLDTYQRNNNKKKINFGQTLSFCKILVDWIAQSYTESCLLKIKFFMLFEIETAHELIFVSVSKRISVNAYEAPDDFTI